MSLTTLEVRVLGFPNMNDVLRTLRQANIYTEREPDHETSVFVHSDDIEEVITTINDLGYRTYVESLSE